MSAIHPPTPSLRAARDPHVTVWLVWAVTGLVLLQAAPTPPAVLLLIGVSALVVETCAERPAPARAFPALLAAAACFAALRVALTALTTHGGTDVVAQLPSLQLPALLGGFTVGGAIHRAVVLRSLTEGLVVVGVIAVLAAFNAVVSHHELLRLLPRAFHELALVVTVAMAFVPSALAGISAVREGDRARTGLPVAARRGWARRLGAVLEHSMERAVLLSESMESRGFGHSGPGDAERRGSRLALLGLFACAAAFGAVVARRPGLALALGLGGVAALTAAVALVSRGRPRGGLRTRALQRGDVVLIALLASAAGGVLALRAAAPVRWDVHADALPPLPAALLPLLLLVAAPAVDALLRKDAS